jgi:hypothetical protein
MNDGPTILLVTYLASSAVMVGCGIPLYRRKIGRNKWLGFRTKLSMSDDAMWYATNRTAGLWLVVTGAGTALAAVAAPFIGMNDVESATLVTGGMLTGITPLFWPRWPNNGVCWTSGITETSARSMPAAACDSVGSERDLNQCLGSWPLADSTPACLGCSFGCQFHSGFAG